MGLKNKKLEIKAMSRSNSQLIAEIGGLIAVIRLFSTGLTYLIADSMFKSSILDHLFMIKKHGDNDLEDQSKKI